MFNSFHAVFSSLMSHSSLCVLDKNDRGNGVFNSFHAVFSYLMSHSSLCVSDRELIVKTSDV